MNDLKITPLNIGSLLFNLSAIYRLEADHPFSGRSFPVPITCYHIALPNRSVLVDAPAYEVASLGRMLIPDFVPPPGLVEQLEGAGIEPEAITDVVITHRHFDHFSGLTSLVDGRYQPNFPNAQHYLGVGDWQPEDFGDLEARTLVVVEEAGLLQLVDQPKPLGDGLLILPMPGETPGHQILALDSADMRRYFTGDLFHHELEFTFPEDNVFWADGDMISASKAAFRQQAAAIDHAVYFAHIPGPYQVSAVGEGYTWQSISGR